MKIKLSKVVGLIVLFVLTVEEVWPQTVGIQRKDGRQFELVVKGYDEEGVLGELTKVAYLDIERIEFPGFENIYKEDYVNLSIRKVQCVYSYKVGTYDEYSKYPRIANWFLKNREAVFEKIFEKQMDSLMLVTSMYSYLKSKSFIRDLEVIDGVIKGRIENWQIDYKKYEANWAFTAGGFSTGKWEGAFTVKTKSGRYKVEAESFSVDMGKVNINYGLGIGASNNAGTNWSEWILKKNRLQFKEAERNDAIFLSKVLEDLFDIKKVNKTDNDW